MAWSGAARLARQVRASRGACHEPTCARDLILALAMTLISEKQYGSAALQLLGWHTRLMVWTFRIRSSPAMHGESESV